MAPESVPLGVYDGRTGRLVSGSAAPVGSRKRGRCSGELLARRRRLEAQERTPLPSFGGQGLQAGVDLDDGAALLELMERGDGPA
ncbi:MAG: hypothetical protein JSV86_03965 [Gemmatimonadota bacterium]|nr:MAG: hypothetical protein JSV86_03965 [Gemmatimonadota bacterium]